MTTARSEAAGEAALEVLVASAMNELDVAATLAALRVPEARLIAGATIAIDQAMSAGRAASALMHGGMSMLYA